MDAMRQITVVGEKIAIAPVIATRAHHTDPAIPAPSATATHPRPTYSYAPSTRVALVLGWAGKRTVNGAHQRAEWGSGSVLRSSGSARTNAAMRLRSPRLAYIAVLGDDASEAAIGYAILVRVVGMNLDERPGKC